MHSIELIFCVYNAGHRRTNPIDFDEYRINSFFTGVQKISYTLRPMESTFLKGFNIQTVHSIQLKFRMYIIGHHWTKAPDFGEFLIHVFL